MVNSVNGTLGNRGDASHWCSRADNKPNRFARTDIRLSGANLERKAYSVNFASVAKYAGIAIQGIGMLVAVLLAIYWTISVGP